MSLMISIFPALILRCLAFGIAAIYSAPVHSADHVMERGGNIFVRMGESASVQLTSSGSDSEPDLSFDRKKVVFIRRISAGASEIWLVAVDRPAAFKPLVRSPVEVKGRKFPKMYTPKFSADGAYVYFLVPLASVTNAIVRVSLISGPPEFVTAAHTFTIIRAGKYRGDLVARVRKAQLAPGYYDWYWLLTPEGKEIGLVGKDEGDVALFLEQEQSP